MMKVKYVGPSDAYEFSSADLASLGEEFEDTMRFPVNEPVEVHNRLGKALISDEGDFATFPFEQAEDDEETPDEGDAVDERPETNFPDADPETRAVVNDVAETEERTKAKKQAATAGTPPDAGSGSTSAPTPRGTAGNRASTKGDG